MSSQKRSTSEVDGLSIAPAKVARVDHCDETGESIDMPREYLSKDASDFFDKAADNWCKATPEFSASNCDKIPTNDQDGLEVVAPTDVEGDDEVIDLTHADAPDNDQPSIVEIPDGTVDLPRAPASARLAFPSPAYVDGIETPEYSAAVDAAMEAQMEKTVPAKEHGFFREPADDADIAALRALLPDVFDILMKIPGVALCGSRSIPGIDQAMCGDIDFVVDSPATRRLIIRQMSSPIESDALDAVVEVCFGFKVEELGRIDLLSGYKHHCDQRGIDSLIPRQSCKSNIEVQLIDASLLPVRDFCFDYVQCRVVWCRKENRYFVERTEECIKAHLTGLISHVRSNRVLTLGRLSKLLRKAAYKGFTLAGDVKDVRQLPLVLLANHRDASTRLAHLMSPSYDTSDFVGYVAPILSSELVADLLPCDETPGEMRLCVMHKPTSRECLPYEHFARPPRCVTVIVGSSTLYDAVPMSNEDPMDSNRQIFRDVEADDVGEALSGVIETEWLKMLCDDTECI